MAEATLENGTSLLSREDAVNLLLANDTPEEDKVEVSEEAPLEVEETSDEDTEADEVEVEAEAEESDSEEVEEDEPEEEEEAEEAPVVEEPQRYRRKAGEEEVEVTLDELRNSYMRNADYTRKTQQVAEQRKAAEAELEHLQGERNRYADQLETLEQALSQQEPPQEYWDKLYQENPMEYTRQKDLARDRKDALQNIEQEKQRVQQEQMTQLQAQAEKQMAQERIRLTELIPEWTDSQKAQAEKNEVITYAQRYGYSNDELSRVSDSRAVALMRKAMLYDKLMEAKPAATKRTTKAPKMTKSGQPQSKKQQTQRRRRDALANIGKQKGRNAMDAAGDYLLTK